MKDLNKNRNGYKHTPLGWIPEEWSINEYENVYTISNKKYDPLEKINNYRCVELEHLSQNSGTLLSYTYSSLQKSSKNIFKKGDLLFGKLRPYLRKYWYASFDGVCSSEIWVIEVNEDICYPLYGFYILQSEQFIYACNKTTGTKMPRADWNYVKLNTFVLPQFPEQIKIASTLLACDKVIGTTESLLSAKEQLKKGLMQQLLTGKKRLPGFKGEWKKLGAGEVFKNISIKGNENEQLLSATQDKGIIPRSMLEARVTMPSGELNSFKLVEPGDFVISLRSFQGGLEYSYYKGLVSPAYNVLKPKLEIDEEFYKYYFKSYDFIGHLAIAVIGIRDGKQISYDDFCTVRIPYPSIDEQKSIGKVFVTLDKEINILKSQLELYRQQKKGLMQVLLTGAVRVKVMK